MSYFLRYAVIKETEKPYAFCTHKTHKNIYNGWVNCFSQPLTEVYPLYKLKPKRPFLELPIILVFAHIKHVFIDNDLKVAIVKDFTIMAKLRKAITEMTSFILSHPEAVLRKDYEFIKDFLVTFGAKESMITRIAEESVCKDKNCESSNQSDLSNGLHPTFGLVHENQKLNLVATEEKQDRVPEEEPILQYFDDNLTVAEEVEIGNEQFEPQKIDDGIKSGNGNQRSSRNMIKNKKYFGDSYLNAATGDNNKFQITVPGQSRQEENCIGGESIDQYETTDSDDDGKNVEEALPQMEFFTHCTQKKRRKLPYEQLPYECPYCPTRFSWIHNTNNHIKKKHQDFPLVPTSTKRILKQYRDRGKPRCPVCDYETHCKIRFKKHMKKLHPEITDLIKGEMRNKGKLKVQLGKRCNKLSNDLKKGKILVKSQAKANGFA